MQITRYLDVNPNAKPGDVLKWVLSHSPNPLPQATTNSITKLVTRIRVEQSIEYQNPLNRDKPNIDVPVSTYITNIDKIRQLLSEVSREERNMVASELGSQGYGIFGGVTSALKDIIHHRAANVPDHEAIRSTIISACCGPDVTFQALSKMLGIYGNRNYMKLEVYRKRREAYFAGQATNLRGERYASDKYGYTKEVMNFMRQ